MCLTGLERNSRSAAVSSAVRTEVGDVLHPGLDSLRHEQAFLFGRLQSGEELPQALAIPVMGDGEADSPA